MHMLNNNTHEHPPELSNVSICKELSPCNCKPCLQMFIYLINFWTQSTHNHSTCTSKYWAFRELSPLPWGVHRSGQSVPGRSQRRPAAPGCSQSDPRAWTPSRNAQVHGTVTCSPVNAPTLAGFGKIRWKKEHNIQYTVKMKCNYGMYLYRVHMIYKKWDFFA